jgi:UDP-3-O-[3-hydroxymyristoyl] glucosamine N-acyltransferase
MKLKDIALLLEGEIAGDPDIEIKGVRGLDEAREDDITFLASKKHMALATRSSASCIMVADFLDGIKTSQLKVKDPQYAFAMLLGRLHKRPGWPRGTDPRAFVADDADVAADASVQAFSYVSSGVTIGKRTVICPGVFLGQGASIGEDCMLYPNVVIMDSVTVGNRVVIHAGSVVGSDGFGYLQREGKNIKVPQMGGVSIHDDVEIGACVTIDRATTGNTVIGSGTKIDNLVQIAHNVKIGENSIVVAQVGIAGSSVVGNNVMIGGQAAVSDHVNIEDGTVIGGRSGVMGSLEKGVYFGTPPIPHRQWLKASALFARLPEIYKKLASLEEKIKDIQGEGQDNDER